VLHGIDHVLIATADPEAAARELEEELGLRATGGGHHAGLGTWNRLVFLNDGSYLELIGVENADEAGRWAVGVATMEALAQGGGFAGYALDCRPIDADVRVLTGYGSRIGRVVAGSRRREDGELVAWRSALPPRIGAHGIPFLIEHLASGVEWSPEAVAERARFAHPIGSRVLLSALELPVPGPESLAADYARDLGVTMRIVGGAVVATVGRHLVRLVRRTDDAPVTLRLVAEAASRQVDLLGVRFSFERAAMAVGAVAAE
jgi:hypothetical protein